MKILRENIVSLGRPLLPGWFIKAIIIAALTTGVAGIGAWIGGVNRIVGDAAAVNRVQDVQIMEQSRRTSDVVEQLKVTNSTLSDIRDQLAGHPKTVVRYVYIPTTDPKGKPKSDQEVLNGM
jgi:hypothetical protein